MITEFFTMDQFLLEQSPDKIDFGRDENDNIIKIKYYNFKENKYIKFLEFDLSYDERGNIKSIEKNIIE